MRFFRLCLLCGIFLSACNPGAMTPVQQTAVADSIIQQIEVKQTSVALTLTPTATPTEKPATATPTITPTPAPSATPTWVMVGKGQKLTVPILMYHHVRSGEKPARYDTSPEMFKAQMNALKEWGYTTITAAYLVSVMRNGGELPEKPVVITFDDGDLDVYENAFPIMRDLGMVGTFYIVTNRLKSDGFVNADQLREMGAAGWEIGSHSHTHMDLGKNHGSMNEEIRNSKNVLEEAIGMPVYTYAYPFGSFDSAVGNYTAASGYIGGVGLGTSYIHSIHVVYYLSRLEVRGEFGMAEFSKMLPWSPVSTPIAIQ
mgnify:CR=1 FL=1